MKVLHFYKAYLPDSVGGVEQVISQLINSTSSLGVVSEVLTLSSKIVEKTIKIDNHYVHRCRSNFEVASTPFSVSSFLKFRQLVKKADIIHYHFPYPFADLLHLLTKFNKPTVITYHSDIVKQKHLLVLYNLIMNKFI